MHTFNILCAMIKHKCWFYKKICCRLYASLGLIYFVNLRPQQNRDAKVKKSLSMLLSVAKTDTKVSEMGTAWD